MTSGEYKIFDCTESSPWNSKMNFMAVRHHGAEQVGEQENGWPAGDVITMRCRFCGHEWQKELPQ